MLEKVQMAPCLLLRVMHAALNAINLKPAPAPEVQAYVKPAFPGVKRHRFHKPGRRNPKCRRKYRFLHDRSLQRLQKKSYHLPTQNSKVPLKKIRCAAGRHKTVIIYLLQFMLEIASFFTSFSVKCVRGSNPCFRIEYSVPTVMGRIVMGRIRRWIRKRSLAN
jgi:hypothetical protein